MEISEVNGIIIQYNIFSFIVFVIKSVRAIPAINATSYTSFSASIEVSSDYFGGKFMTIRLFFGSGPGFVNRTQSDPSFVNPVRSGPGFVNPIPSDPIRSGFVTTPDFSPWAKAGSRYHKGGENVSDI